MKPVMAASGVRSSLAHVGDEVGAHLLDPPDRGQIVDGE
jgi:hypothetical protein